MSWNRILSVFVGVALSAGLNGCGREPALNLLVITLDTTRADFLGCYGKESARTPNLDRLAAEGFLFENAYSPVPITLPSHSTIFTGRYPMAHGVRDNGLFQLPDSETTLAERLRDRGYETGAVIGAFPLTRKFNTDQGFEYFDDHITAAAEDYRGLRVDPKQGLYFDERPAPQVNTALLPWLREHLDAPFFAWIHYWDAHHPHIPPPPYNQLFRHDLYQGEIAFVDANLGTIIRELERAGVWDRTVVVVVGDHGEGRGEHNEESHSMLAYNTTLQVPLLIRVPGQPGGVRISERVGTVDISPTVSELLDVGGDPAFQGRSLTGLMGIGDGPTEPRTYYAETLSPRLSYGWGELRAIYDGPYKYIHGPEPELFNLDQDPGERQNLLSTEPDRAGRLLDDLKGFLAHYSDQGAASATAEVDTETRQRLAALGYISSSGDQALTISEELRADGAPPQDRIGDMSLMSNAKHRINAGDYLSGMDLAQRLIDRDPDNAYYRGLLASALLGLGRIDQAAEVIEAALSITAQNDAVVLELANRLFSAGDRQRGLDIALRVLTVHESAYGRYLVGEMRGALGRTDLEERDLRRAMDLDPGYAAARTSLSVLLAEQGRFDEAETVFLDLIRDFPLDERIHFNYAVMLLKEARWDDALQRLDRATELRPRYWSAHIARLAVLVQTARLKQAEALADWIRQHCPDQQIVTRAQEIVRTP